MHRIIVEEKRWISEERFLEVREAHFGPGWLLEPTWTSWDARSAVIAALAMGLTFYWQRGMVTALTVCALWPRTVLVAMTESDFQPLAQITADFVRQKRVRRTMGHPVPQSLQFGEQSRLLLQKSRRFLSPRQGAWQRG